MSFGTRRNAAPAGVEPSTDVEAAREEALKQLDRARRTRSDLAKRLHDKGYAEATVAEALERLAAVGLVDDAEYARAFLAGRWGRKPAGWRRLQQELRSRGVGDEAVAAARAAIEQRDGVVDELSAAQKVVAQAARRMAALEPRVRNQRLYALLARRGFDGDLIRRVLALEKLAHED